MLKKIKAILTKLGIELSKEQEVTIADELKGTQFFKDEESLNKYVDTKKNEWVEESKKLETRKETISKALEKANIKPDMRDDFITLAGLNEIEDDTKIDSAINDALKTRSYFKAVPDPQKDIKKEDPVKPTEEPSIIM